jgi:hypothetical protein
MAFIRYVLTLRSKRRDPETSYCVYVPNILQRVASAVKIQSMWRGYKTRSQTKVISQVLRQRAANRIQRWVRNLPFHHRLKFLKYIREDLTNTTGCRLVIHELLYFAIATLPTRKFLKLPLQPLVILTNGEYVRLKVE